MGVDWTVVVAAWLTERPRRLVPLRALGALLRDIPSGNQREAAATEVRAVLDQLDAAGLVVVAHHYPTPLVGVLDCDGLRRIAGTRLLDPAESGSNHPQPGVGAGSLPGWTSRTGPPVP